MLTRFVSLAGLALLTLQFAACSGETDAADPAGTGAGANSDDAGSNGDANGDGTDGDVDGAGGSGDSTASGGASGGSTDPGGTCIEGEVTDDGCNTCSCLNGAFLCTLKACLEPETCVDGASRPAPDGCNTCTCFGGEWGCTKIGCEPIGSGETFCGARAGDTCSDTEYCAYEAGDYCGAADAESICKPRPEICTADENPVCGCDGKAYSNACVAASAGTGVLNSGGCEN